jgi:hypothetical protein
MNRSLLFLAIILLISACKKNNSVDDIPAEPIFDNENWTRLRIPDGGEIRAVAGSIDDTLLVTTLYNTYMVTNKGNTFTLTTLNLNRTPGLLVAQDTIYALNGDAYDGKFEKHYASLSSYYTLDKGLNWHPTLYKDWNKTMLTGVVTNKKNITFQLNYHSGADKNGMGYNWVLPTTISKMDEKGFHSTFEHPIKDEQPINLYLDQMERLYITTGGSFSESGVYIGPSALSPAYVYISKGPI